MKCRPCFKFDDCKKRLIAKIAFNKDWWHIKQKQRDAIMDLIILGVSK